MFYKIMRSLNIFDKKKVKLLTSKITNILTSRSRDQHPSKNKIQKLQQNDKVYELTKAI